MLPSKKAFLGCIKPWILKPSFRSTSNTPKSLFYGPNCPFEAPSFPEALFMLQLCQPLLVVSARRALMAKRGRDDRGIETAAGKRGRIKNRAIKNGAQKKRGHRRRRTKRKEATRKSPSFLGPSQSQPRFQAPLTPKRCFESCFRPLKFSNWGQNGL